MDRRSFLAAGTPGLAAQALNALDALTRARDVRLTPANPTTGEIGLQVSTSLLRKTPAELAGVLIEALAG